MNILESLQQTSTGPLKDPFPRRSSPSHLEGLQHDAAGSGSVGSSSGTAQTGATVTANDFLTLLVTELKNQDPTANTDPDAYVNQLVQVNSLQQLIQINGDLSGLTNPAAPQNGSSQASAAVEQQAAPGSNNVTA